MIIYIVFKELLDGMGKRFGEEILAVFKTQDSAIKFVHHKENLLSSFEFSVGTLYVEEHNLIME